MTPQAKRERRAIRQELQRIAKRANPDATKAQTRVMADIALKEHCADSLQIAKDSLALGLTTID